MLCMSVSVCVSVYGSVRIYVYLCLCVYECMCVSVCVYVWVCRRVCVLGHQRSFLYGDLRIKRKALLVSSKHFVPNKYGRPELSKF